jgi:hypothetical protein
VRIADPVEVDEWIRKQNQVDACAREGEHE